MKTNTKILRLPSLGRIGYERSSGGSAMSLMPFKTNLKTTVYRNCQPLKAKDYTSFASRLINGIKSNATEIDWGSGKINEQFVMGLANDTQGTSTDKAAPLFTQYKYMYSGTSSTSETSYDYGLGTAVNIASGSITPTIAIVASSNNFSLQYVGTINYTGTNAINEWGLFNAAVNGSQYNTSTDTFTSTTATPGTSPSWTVNTWAGYSVISGTTSGTANNSGAAYYGGFIISNSATALTIGNPNWYVVNNNGGSGGPPSTNTRMDIWPGMADHKTFSTINVINGDSIQFTYTMTLPSGG